MGITCAFFAAWVFVITRKLKAVHFSLMLFHYGWIATLLFIAWALGDFWLYGKTTVPTIFLLNWEQWKYLSIISVMNTIAQFFATLAF